MPSKITPPPLSPIEETLFITLFARADDATWTHSILRDRASADLADRIDYDPRKLKLDRKLAINTALRARHLDQWVSRFAHAHPGCSIVDLGCGLDTRRLRIQAPGDCVWFEMDHPAVLELRGRVLAPDGRCTPLAGDLAEPDWLEAVPRDRPAIIVADGVLPFLDAEVAKALFDRITRHVGRGEIVFNGYTRLAVRLMKRHPTIRALGVVAGAGFDDVREPLGWGRGLVFLEEQPLVASPFISALPAAYRLAFRLLARSAFMRREGGRVLRYGFGAVEDA